MKGAIWAAYADTGTLAITCPHCGAEPKQWCTRDDGRVRRTPCIDRIANSGSVSGVHDFAEPRHPKGE